MSAGDDATERRYRALQRRINREYKQAQEELTEKLHEFTAKYEKQDQAKRKQLAEGKITEQQYRNWVKGQVFQGKRWQERVDQVARQLTQVDETATAIANGTRLGVFADNANFQNSEAEKALGVRFDLYDSATVARLLDEQPNLLPPRRVKRSTDIPWYHKQVANAVTQGILQGESIDKIAKRIGEQTGETSRKAMLRNARTAMTSAQNAGRIEAMHQQQDMGIRVQKKWIAANDSRTREAHQQLDGQTVDVDEPFKSILGEILFPGDPAAHPANVYNCRCALGYVYPKYQPEIERGTEEEILAEERENREQTQGVVHAAKTEGESKRWHTREEYEQARANRETLYKEERKQAEQWYDAEIDRILDAEFGGGNFIAQRIAIKRDESLTEEEKERKLQEVDEKREQFFKRRNEVAKERDRMMAVAREKCDATFDPEYEYEKISGTLSLDDQVRAVNPHYSEGVEYQVNCQSCGFGFELRMRGYDVEATGAPMTRGTGAEANFVYAFGKAEFSSHGDRHENTVAIRDQMLQWGDGARGIVSIERANGEAGHIMNVAVVDGHFCVIDSQCGLFFSDAESGNRVYGMSIEGDGVTSVTLYRTDNKPIKYVPESWIMRKKH